MSTFLNNKLKEYREKYDYNQTKIAELIGVDTSQVSRYESGESLPPVNKMLSLEEHKEEKYNPEFVCALKSCKKEPMEGWGYLDGMARFSATSFDIFSPEWADKLARNYRIILDYNSPECERFQYFGWPSEYNFPDKKTVQEEINMMKIELENDKNGRGK